MSSSTSELMLDASPNFELPEDAMLPTNMPVSEPESCMVCAAEFSTEEELVAHLIGHTEEEFYVNMIKEMDEREALKQKTPVKRPSVNAPSNSIPEVITIDDDSGDESSKPPPKVSRVGNANSVSPLNRGARFQNSNGVNNVRPQIHFLKSGPQNGQQGVPVEVASPGVVRHSTPIQNRTPGSGRKSGVPSMPPSTTPMKSPVSANQSTPNRSPVCVNQSTPKRSPAIAKSANAPAVRALSTASFTCKICPMKFTNENAYKEHALTHPKKQFVCQICNTQFAFESTLRLHLEKHVGEKNHECRICHMKFALKSVLKKHEETHKGEEDKGDSDDNPKSGDNVDMNKFSNLGLSISISKV